MTKDPALRIRLIALKVQLRREVLGDRACVLPPESAKERGPEGANTPIPTLAEATAND
jgi:hypothetical protein